MADVTAIILTKNEEQNIVACLASIRGFAVRALVVDSGSTDRTVELARAHGAEVLTHPFQYYAQQFNWAIDNGGITTRWTLRLDADERFTPEVCRVSEALLSEHAEDGVSGIVMESDYFFLGKQIRHAMRKKRKIMLFKTGIGRIEDRKRDAHTLVSTGSLLEIRPRFVHHDCKDLSSYVARYNWYAIRELQDYLAYKNGAEETVNTDKTLQKTRGQKFGVYYKAPRFFRAWLWFVWNYIFRLGFLDGREGFLFCWFECYWYRLLIDAKIFEQEKLGLASEELKAFGE